MSAICFETIRRTINQCRTTKCLQKDRLPALMRQPAVLADRIKTHQWAAPPVETQRGNQCKEEQREDPKVMTGLTQNLKPSETTAETSIWWIEWDIVECYEDVARGTMIGKRLRVT